MELTSDRSAAHTELLLDGTVSCGIRLYSRIFMQVSLLIGFGVIMFRSLFQPSDDTSIFVAAMTHEHGFLSEFVIASSGVSMPRLIYGTGRLGEKARIEGLVLRAVRAGFRGLDIAWYYEHEVGSALAVLFTTGIAREILFIQAKVRPNYVTDLEFDACISKQVELSIANTLWNLGIKYVDSLILIAPYPGHDQTMEAWHAMEAAKQAGLARQLGLSDVATLAELQNIYGDATIKPAVVKQHAENYRRLPLFQPELRAWCATEGIHFQTFGMLTANRGAIDSNAMQDLSIKYDVSPSVLFLRYAMGLGIMPVTGTTSVEHMTENLGAHRVPLEEQDAKVIDDLLEPSSGAADVDKQDGLHISEAEEEPAQECEGESLHWLNTLVARLWPKIDEGVRKAIHEHVTPLIQEKLPKLLRSQFRFTRFTLGTAPPVCGPIKVVDKPWGVKLEIQMCLNSTADIELSLLAPIGIKRLHFRGELVLQIGSLLAEAPFIGSIRAYFLEPPDFDLEFTGIGQVATFPGLTGIVHSSMMSYISGQAVLPHLVSIQIGSEEQGVDRSLLSAPEPMGVLRVRALKAEGLKGADFRAFKKRTSDPYVRLQLSHQVWMSSVVKKNRNPNWLESDVHDFMFSDKNQKLSIEVWDENLNRGDVLLGYTRSLKVGDAVLTVRDNSLQLFGFGGSESSSPGLGGSESSHSVPRKPCGSLQLKFEWFQLVPDQVTSTGCVVIVQIKKVMIPEALAVQGAFNVKIGSFERETPVVAALPRSTEETDLTNELLMEVVKRSSQIGIEAADIAKITDLTEECVLEILATDIEAHFAKLRKSCSGQKKAVRPLKFDRTLYFPIAAEDLHETVEMSLVDGTTVLGHASFSLHDVRASPTLSVPDDKQATFLHKLQDDDDEQTRCYECSPIHAQVKVSLQGLSPSMY